MKTKIINQIIKAGIAAPSADNSQPWQYSQTGNIIHLYIDKTRAGKISDTRYLLSDIALGCVAENMLIQGRHLGFEGKVQYFPNDEATSPLFPLSITFKKAETTESISANAIYARKTDRSFPWKGPVDKDAKQRIQAETFGIDGVNLHWLNKKQRKIACKALFLAESLRFSNKKFHQELFSSIDFNLNWKQSSTEHLAPAALNIEFFAKPIFKAARNWNTMKILNIFGAAKMFGFRSAVMPTLLSPELCLITTNKRDRQRMIETGRAMQRTWLKATELGLSVHPLASAGVMSLNLFDNKNKGTDKIKAYLKELSNKDQGIIFFRMGTAKQRSTKLAQRRQRNTFHL